MPNWAYYLIAFGVVSFLLPFYTFFLSKVAAIGWLSGIRDFVNRCNKGDDGNARRDEN